MKEQTKLEINTTNWKFQRYLTREEFEKECKIKKYSGKTYAWYECTSCGEVRRLNCHSLKSRITKCKCKKEEEIKVTEAGRVNFANWIYVCDLKPGKSLYRCCHCKKEKEIEKYAFKKHLTVCDEGCHGVGRSTRQLIVGVNDLATTHPHLIKYFVNPIEATKCTYGTTKTRIEVRCPDCRTTKTTTPNILSKHGFSCPMCSEGLSYSEKFMYVLLMYLEEKFEFQYTLKKSKRRYDFYLPKHNIIIETHGSQHYVGGFENIGGRTLKEEQENDKIKKEYAIKNGVKLYIELDCRYSELEWIKNSINNSPLREIYNLDSVDWLYIAQQSEKSLVLKVIEYYNETGYNSYQIANKFNLHPTTILNYLKRGSECGLCNYISQKGYHVGGEVVMIKEGVVFHTAKSVREMSEFCNFSKSSIASLARGGGLRKEKPSHFVKSKTLGLVGFYYVNSENWQRDKHKYA